MQENIYLYDCHIADNSALHVQSASITVERVKDMVF